MSVIDKSIEVDVPIRTAYNQWTQFESFPLFMEGVDNVQQLSDTRTHWQTSIAGVSREFDAEIVRQEPDECVAWRAIDGPDQAGKVTFQPIGRDRTLVNVTMDFRPEGTMEKAGDTTGLVERRVAGDLERFKDFIEGRRSETGAWRGSV
ncbi:SRPBCC family protein [Catelliglobosispora koreensis]|uniref:SRPBCC family protein n=1 Tax=Catelliglobosispora koreensis TaxID=129052 RepID=UPI00037FA9F2|nr:SRPBCC family protein [Catelliglobosispora koreensis]